MNRGQILSHGLIAADFAYAKKVNGVLWISNITVQYLLLIWAMLMSACLGRFCIVCEGLAYVVIEFHV
jgi:hypothetical protein